MNNIAGIPYIEARFNKEGVFENPNAVDLPPGITDLLVVSHGWGNDADAARQLYQAFFESFAAVGQPSDLAGRRFAILGVIWPSKKIDEFLAVSAGRGVADDSASLRAADKASLEALEKKLEQMKNMFTEPGQRQTLEAVKALLPQLDESVTAPSEFVNRIRSLIDPAAASRGDASNIFLKHNGNELMKNLTFQEDELDQPSADLQSGAAGSASFLSGFKGAAGAAMNVLNYATYFEMKTRAGNVGGKGLAQLIDKLAPQVGCVHLIGHSFGGRVVAAAAANSYTERIRSMSLLQPTVSQSGFSKSKGGFYRKVVDRKRIHGPIIVTHTKNDKAAALAYPLASHISGDKATGFGDPSDKFGGLGRNGVQQMEAGEVTQGVLLDVGGNYSFQPDKFFNLEASPFVKDHGDVTGPEIAHAVRAAVQISGPPAGGGLPKAAVEISGPPPDGGLPKSPRQEPKPKPVLLGISMPRQVQPGSTFTARFAAYVSSTKTRVEKLLKDLGQKDDRVVTDIPPDRKQYWNIGAPVTIRLTGQHVDIDPSEHSFEWSGRHNLVSFIVTANADVPAPAIQLSFHVFLGPIQIAFIPVSIAISAEGDGRPPKIQTRRLPSSAFASYSSKDIDVVTRSLAALTNFVPSLDIFQDALDLTANAKFKEPIKKEIEKRDAFFLFWSRNASQSEWVLWEIEIARTKPGLDAIFPMPLEDVLIAPPPAGFEDTQLRNRFLVANYGFKKILEELKGTSSNTP